MVVKGSASLKPTTPPGSSQPQLLARLSFETRSQLLVGRAPDNDLHLDGLQISNHHARFARDNAGVTVEDAGSTNGVYVNGERISGRRSCPKCGAVFHVSANPPRRTGFCDKDGTALVQRDDDKPENVKKRMQEYADKTWPLKRFYQERGKVAEVEGVGTPAGILAATQLVLGARH